MIRWLSIVLHRPAFRADPRLYTRDHNTRDHNTRTQNSQFLSFLQGSGFRRVNPDHYERALRRRRTALAVFSWVAVAGFAWVVVESAQALMTILEEVDRQLTKQGRRLLLAFDEFETIDLKVGERVFPEDLLRTIRQSIQSHRQIIWLFAGGSDFEELPHAEWASYLVNVQKVEIPLFSEAECRELLTDPLKTERLGGDVGASLPGFDPAFWGDHGVDIICRQTAGWPNFVQLLAQEAVYLANERNITQVDDALLQAAADAAVDSGESAFFRILKTENRFPGEWDYLLGFRANEVQSEPGDDRLRRSLRRRLLVVEENGMWRMRVPLMRHWLIKRR